MSLYYVRHGMTEWNKERKLQGNSDIPLNEIGIQQAHETSKLFFDTTIDKVYCSPLLRAKQTAEIVCQNMDCEIVVEKRLAERCFGDLEGTNLGKNHVYLWSFDEPLCPHAEDLNDFFSRVQSFIKEIQEECKEKNILLVAHGGVYLPVHEFYHGLDRKMDLMTIVPGNCTVTKFE